MMQIIEFLAAHAAPIIAGCAFGVAVSTWVLSIQLHQRVQTVEQLMARSWLRRIPKE